MTEASPPPRAPGFGELFEQSLTAVVDPSVFRRAAARPAPSFGASAGFALACVAAALAIAVAHAQAASPGLLQGLAPATSAAVAVAGVGLCASLLLLLSVLLHAAAKALGGNGEFERAVQAAAMLAVLAPAQALFNWFPWMWIAPALLAAAVAAGALEGLFHANRGRARALCLVLAAGAIGLQFVGRAFVDRARAAYAVAAAARQDSVPDAELVRSVSALAQQAAAASTPQSSPAAAPATSGLDLLRGGLSEGGEAAGADAALPAVSPAPAATPGPAPTAAGEASAQAMQASAAGMLDAVTPMMNMLSASKNLRPEQKADIKELQGMMEEFRTDIAAKKKMDNAAFQAKMRRYQALLMKVMADSPAPSQTRGVRQVPGDGR